MAQSIKENATRANARTAGAAAIIVAVVMVVQAILQAIIGVFSNLGYGAAGGNVDYLQNTFAPVVGVAQSLGSSILPITIGVFLAFWLVVPLTADLRVTRVVLRSLVASAIASAVSLLITILFAIGGAFASAGPFFGNSFPGADGSYVFYSLVGGVQSVFSTFVGVTPLVVLAGFLAWLWVSKGRPTASETSKNE
jgi:hypothetical protein